MNRQSQDNRINLAEAKSIRDQWDEEFYHWHFEHPLHRGAADKQIHLSINPYDLVNLRHANDLLQSFNSHWWLQEAGWGRPVRFHHSCNTFVFHPDRRRKKGQRRLIIEPEKFWVFEGFRWGHSDIYTPILSIRMRVGLTPEEFDRRPETKIVAEALEPRPRQRVPVEIALSHTEAAQQKLWQHPNLKYKHLASRPESRVEPDGTLTRLQKQTG